MNRGTKGLEIWCRRQIEGYPGVDIHNMSTSWKNGLAFCALVCFFFPHFSFNMAPLFRRKCLYHYRYTIFGQI